MNWPRTVLPLLDGHWQAAAAAAISFSI